MTSNAKWSQVFSLSKFGGGGCPINAVGAIVPYPGRNWFIFFEKDTDRYAYYKKDEKEWTSIYKTSEFGKGSLPFNKVGAAYTFSSQGKDKIMLFDEESSNYVAYFEKPEPTCTRQYNFESDFGGGGAPFANVGAVVPYPGRNWYIIFEKNSGRYTYYNEDKKGWESVFNLNQFGGGGCPFNSIGAAMPYTDRAGTKKIMLFDGLGEKYVYYDEKGKGDSMASHLEALDGSIIVIKSHRWDNAYVELSGNGGAGVREIRRSQLFDATETKLILHHLEGTIVCFESLSARDHYLDMVHDHVLRFSLSNDIPKDKDWAKFSIIGDALDNVSIRSERWDKTRWLDAHHSGRLLGAWHISDNPPTEDWGKFEIRFPAEITGEEYVPIITVENDGKVEKDFEVEFTIGVSDAETNTTTNSVEISIEMEKNFGVGDFTSGSIKFGAKYAHEWSKSNSKTWSQSCTITHTLTLKPGEVKTVKQLVATYGPKKIGMANLIFEDTESSEDTE